jgi:hypothetical protein
MGAILARVGAKYLMFLGAVAIFDTAKEGYNLSRKAVEWHKNRKALKASMECRAGE